MAADCRLLFVEGRANPWKRSKGFVEFPPVKLVQDRNLTRRRFATTIDLRLLFQFPLSIREPDTRIIEIFARDRGSIFDDEYI